MTDAYKSFSLPARFMDVIPHMKDIGMQLTSLKPEQVHLTLPYREDWIGDSVHGLIHPGIVTTLVDSASGLAVMARVGQLTPIATLDLRMDYLWPAVKGLPLNCYASCYRLSTHIAFVRASVWQDDEQKTLATSQSVFMRLARRKERSDA